MRNQYIDVRLLDAKGKADAVDRSLDQHALLLSTANPVLKITRQKEEEVDGEDEKHKMRKFFFLKILI